MRPSWRGSIAFGLVDIHVDLYSAVSPHMIHFTLLHSSCKTPIEYERWCPYHKKEVAWTDIEKGIKLKDGSYFVMTAANLKKLRPTRTEAITIEQFVDPASIDPLLLSTHYYVAPSKPSFYAFKLFTAALEKLHTVAIGHFVLRDKEYVCMIQPYKNILLLTTLNYAYEIKKLTLEKETGVPAVKPAELKLAEQLIKELSKTKFDITKYKDTFAVELVKRIEKAKKGIAIKEEKRALTKLKGETLADTLEASLKKVKPHKAIKRKR